jgi:hypothetical protein
VRTLRCQSTCPVPDIRPVALQGSCFQVHFCEMDAWTDTPCMRSNNIGFSLLIPPRTGIIALEVEMDRI